VLAGTGRGGPDAIGIQQAAESRRGYVALCFQAEGARALYAEFGSRGIEASEPQVGNAAWVTRLSDPDGYRLFFESTTGTPEETKFSEVKAARWPGPPRSPIFCHTRSSCREG